MKKMTAFLLLAVFLLSLMTSCGGASMETGDAATKSDGGMYSAENSEEITATVAKDNAETDDVRKIIKTYHLSLETKNFTEDAALIVSEAEALGGYVANSSVSGNRLSSDSAKSQSARYTIRIPEEFLSTYVTKLSEICNVYSSSLATEDVTDNYYGIKAQLESLILQEEKLNDMLAEAKDLYDMITLDDKLTAVRSEINTLNHRLQVLEKSINYSYVYITLNEVREYHVEEERYLQKLGGAIVGSVLNFVEFLGDFLIVFIWILPFVIVIGGILIVIVVRRKKNKKKKASQEDTKD